MKVVNSGAELTIVGITVSANSETDIPTESLLSFSKDRDVHYYIWTERLSIWDGYQYLTRSSAESLLHDIGAGIQSV